MKRHKRGRDYAVLPGGGVEKARPRPRPRYASCRRRRLVAEIDRLLWTGQQVDRPAWYFLMTAERGRAELSGPEALANNRTTARAALGHRRPVNQLGLHPPTSAAHSPNCSPAAPTPT